MPSIVADEWLLPQVSVSELQGPFSVADEWHISSNVDVPDQKLHSMQPSRVFFSLL